MNQSNCKSDRSEENDGKEFWQAEKSNEECREKG